MSWVSFRQSDDPQVRDDAIKTETVCRKVALLQSGNPGVGRDPDQPTNHCTRFLDPAEPDQAKRKSREAGRENRIGLQGSAGAHQGGLTCSCCQFRCGQRGLGYVA